MSIPRSRSRTIPSPRGSGGNESGTIVLGGPGVTINTYTSTCADSVGDGDCYPFDVDGYSFSGCLLNRPRHPGTSSPGWFENYVPDAFNTTANWPHIGVSGLSSYSTYAAQVAARTNPSRPYVDVPVNILELGDVVQMIRNRGRGIIFDAYELTRTNRRRRHVNNAARANLLYQFGLAPLIGDLVKLNRFQEQVNNRLKEIKRLQGPRGLRRTVSLDAASAISSKQLTMQSVVASTDTPKGLWTGNTTTEIRAHIRWNAGTDADHLMAPDEMRELAIRSVLGLTVDPSTLWEAIPWSWLIDWGSSVGNYLKSKRNIIPATLSGVWIMENSRTEWTCPPDTFGGGDGKMQAGTFYRWSKSRSGSVPVTPTAHFPFLNGRQVGILASLAVTRR